MSGLDSEDDDTLPPILPTPSSPTVDRPRADNTSSRFSPSSPYLAQVEEDLLSRTIQDSGLHAFGTVFIEVWVLSTDGRQSRVIREGHWMDPVFMRSAAPGHVKAKEVNETVPDCAPGESLAGTLFNEIGSRWRRFGSKYRTVHWRQIKSMMADPFIPHDGRMEELFKLGIGIVGTVPFSFQERIGIVLFMSRSTAMISKLRSKENERYLIGSTDFIGCAFAICGVRMECAKLRREEHQSAMAKVRKRVREKGDKPSFATAVLRASEIQKGHLPTLAPPSRILLPCGTTEEEWADQHTEQPPASSTNYAQHDGQTEESYQVLALEHFKHWIQEMARQIENSVLKWRGSGLHAPPRANLIECLVAWVGVFCVMLALVRADYTFQGPWTFDPGWFSSTLCIVFTMTAAPSGQPPQIVCAHIWNALVGLAMRQIPSNDLKTFFEWEHVENEERHGFILPVAWKQAMSVAFGVSGMAYLGIMHPPASALSYTFVTNSRFNIRNVIMVLLGDFIIISMSVVILNLSKFKQYPIYWIGFSWKYAAGLDNYVAEGWLTRRKKKRQDMMENNDGMAMDSSVKDADV